MYVVGEIVEQGGSLYIVAPPEDKDAVLEAPQNFEVVPLHCLRLSSYNAPSSDLESTQATTRFPLQCNG